MDNQYPDSVRIFPNNENSNGEIDVTVFFRVNGEELVVKGFDDEIPF